MYDEDGGGGGGCINDDSVSSSQVFRRKTQRHHPVDGVFYTRNLILRGMSAIYLMAFISFYYQSPGESYEKHDD